MHGTASPRVIATLIMLLVVCLGQRAAAGFIRADEPGSITFTVEKSPGKNDWISAKFSINGDFSIYTSTQIVNGTLPEHESRRIFEELEKLIAAADLHIATPPPVPPLPVGIQKVRTFIEYCSPQGRIIIVRGADFPPPLITFLRTLWYKLQHHHTQSTEAAASAAAAPTVQR